jgi:hypothetical protein
MRVADAEESFAMIDLVAHLYRGSRDDRRALATIWTRYSDATVDERRRRGFEIVRMHHATLSRIFRDGARDARETTTRSNRACFVGSDSATATDRTDARHADPDGEYLDIDDVRTTWEEFVDALRDASGVAAAEEEEPASGSPNAYVALETPVMRRNQSFSRLAQDLEEMVVRSQKSSPGSSNAGTPEGSTRGIQRISSRGLLLGVGCSSRDVSARGGNAFYSASTLRSDDVARALEKTTTSTDTA